MLRRHDLVFVSSSSWQALVAAREDLGVWPLVAEWADRRLPFVVRRRMPQETSGVALGLPLPPALGRGRIDLLVRAADVVGSTSPPELTATMGAAPPEWRPTLARIARLAQRHCVRARVFGSLAWSAITGLEYLRPASDVDLLLPFRTGSDALSIAAGIDAIEQGAPMRLDGEMVREDGTAVNWRELRTGHAEVLAKTRAGIRLVRSDRFRDGLTL
jgi:phosphoribosyl-dephospho-CoA transferase